MDKTIYRINDVIFVCAYFDYTKISFSCFTDRFIKDRVICSFKIEDVMP